MFLEPPPIVFRFADADLPTVALPTRDFRGLGFSFEGLGLRA